MREVIIEDEVKYKLADLKQELLVSQGQVKGTKTFNSILSMICLALRWEAKNQKNIGVSSISMVVR